MGRKLTTPKDAKPISAKIPAPLQVALHQVVGKRWEKTGRKPSQNELLVEAVGLFVEREGINVSQIEKNVSEWNGSRSEAPQIAALSSKQR